MLYIFPEAWGAREGRIGGTYDFQSESWNASAGMIALDLVVGRLTFRLASVTHKALLLDTESDISGGLKYIPLHADSLIWSLVLIPAGS